MNIILKNGKVVRDVRPSKPDRGAAYFIDDLNQTAYYECDVIYVDEYEQLPHDSFFYRHPDAFAKIAATIALNPAEWNCEPDPYIGSVKRYRHREIHSLLARIEHGVVTEFEDSRYISTLRFRYSWSEDKLYRFDEFNGYSPLSEDCGPCQECLEIVRKIYGKEK